MRKNKLKKIIETSQNDWNRLMGCNVSDREELHNVLKEELTRAQIDEIYNEIEDFYDYLYYIISL